MEETNFNLSKVNQQNLESMRTGSPRQQRAFHTLELLGVFRDLAAFNPVLTGTIPLGIDLPGSDLDIVCYASDLLLFQDRVQTLYGSRPDFHMQRKPVVGEDSVIARFDVEGFPVELFAQAKPVEQQRAYRHMRVESRLLDLGGPEGKAGIRRLRESGLKTEPAFAAYFSLPGDPYLALLALYPLDDRAVTERVGL